MRGLVASSWRLDGDTFHLHVLIPPGATATVHIPTASPSDVLESGAPVGSVGGGSDLRPGEGELACRLVSGRYSFTAAR